MIELSQIQNTSKLKELRGQINTMVDEINGNQMVIGQVLNPSAKFYDGMHNLMGTVTASQWLMNQMYAVCMPESNGLYVAQVFGAMLATPTLTKDNQPIAFVEIDIPSVKLPNRETAVSTFVTPEHLGFTPADEHLSSNTGLLFGAIAKTPNGYEASATDASLCSEALKVNATILPLNLQALVVSPTGDGLTLNLWYNTIDLPQS